MFEHMAGQNAIDASIWKRKPNGYIQPKVLASEQVSIDVDESRFGNVMVPAPHV
jgi:hypothetical protein